jgi:hypothetical protein
MRSLEKDFTFYERGRFISGREAHIAHLVFHDVPHELCEHWASAEAA